jgi:TP901 family phage tail tape measure protein
MASFVVPSIFTAVDKVSSVVKYMGNNVTSFASKAEASIARAERVTRRLTPGLSDAGKQFFQFASAAALTATVMGGINYSVGALKDYDKALGSLQAVTGLADDKFGSFKSKIIEVAGETKVSAVDTAKAFELIGSANSKLLESADAMGLVTKSAIILSQASGDDLATSASSLVGVMNQFNLEASQADRTMNVLAAGAKVGAATIPQVAESMKNFGSVAASANLSVEESVALVEVLSQKSVFGAEAGTKLRGSVLQLQKAGLGYTSGQFNMNDALSEANKKIASLSTAKQKDALVTKLFGAENVSTGKILLANVGQYNEFTKGVTGTSEALTQAAIKNNTLDKSLDQLKAAWVNMLVGNSKATSGINAAKKAVQFLTKNLDAVVTVVGILVGSMILFKGVLIASRVVLFAYNLSMGIYNALFTTSLVLTNKNIVAQRAYAITSKIAVVAIDLFAGAQWLLNAAMSANPIGLLIVGIAALIALVVLAIVKYNEWGAALTFILGPFGIIINLIQSFRRNWDIITAAFKEGGVLAGFKAIGATIMDAVLMPLQQVFKLLSNLPVIGGFASSAVSEIQKIRDGLGVNTITDESGEQLESTKAAPLLNTQAEKQANMKKMFAESRSTVDFNVNDPTGRGTVSSSSENVKIKLTSTRP